MAAVGGNGGDTDRYVAGILFGCIPVMLNTSHTPNLRIPQSLPLEEVLPWHHFSTLADVADLGDLSRQLECLMPHIPRLRAELKHIWRAMLYTSVLAHALKQEPYLGESGEGDAFVTLMQVLASRVPHGYRPSPKILRRMSHPGTLFPCRPDSGSGAH